LFRFPDEMPVENAISSSNLEPNLFALACLSADFFVFFQSASIRVIYEHKVLPLVFAEEGLKLPGNATEKFANGLIF